MVTTLHEPKQTDMPNSSTIMQEPKQTDMPNSSTIMPLKHVCTYNGIKDNKQV